MPDIVKGWREAGFYVSDNITQANFPLTVHPATEDVEIEVIDPGCGFDENEGLEFLKAAGLNRPTTEHALRFAEQCGKSITGKKPLVVFLHKPWQDPSHYQRVLRIRREPGYREFDLFGTDRGFQNNCVLAGVRSRKQSSGT